MQLTRQGVASAALADYYDLTRNPRAAAAIARMLTAFGKRSLPIERDRLQSLIAWTRIQSAPVGHWRIGSLLKEHGLLYTASGSGRLVSPDRNYANAYAGATGLALLTEVRYAHATGDQQFASLRAGWLDGLIALRIPGDGFRQIPDSIDTHPYYDGEPWLALAEYHRAFPQDARVAAMLPDLDDALVRKYGAKFAPEFFHWGTMAAAVRYAGTRDARLLDFIRAQSAEFLNRMDRRPIDEDQCSALEGLAAAMSVLQVAGDAHGALYRRVLDRTRVEMRKLWPVQIAPGQTELTFANASIVAPRMREFAGAFRNGTYLAATRIDTTGHCLSAMVELQRQRIVLQP